MSESSAARVRWLVYANAPMCELAGSYEVTVCITCQRVCRNLGILRELAKTKVPAEACASA